MLRLCLLIGCAGFVGTVCRYGVMRLPWGANFAWGPLAVNIFGAFLAGFCQIWVQSRFPEHASWSPILFVGFFGAFTTFSTYAVDAMKYFTSGHTWLFLACVGLHNILGLIAAGVGITLARRLLGLH